ncbi:MAG: hypothetical protein HYU04_00775 [Candidatus Wildermuthbacteria bacterium]|nr:hypothetical protein [Candidatus Wildermuthbacteria bacterium]
MLAPYACTAGIKGGIARCRKLVPCPDHGDDAVLAPRPDVVLVKINLNKVWGERFANEGIQVLQRTWDRAQQLGDEHVQRAQQLGRNALYIREEQARQGLRENADVPEAADSGCPVFGADGLKDGVQGSSITRIGFQLRDSGYRLVHAHRLMRDWKPPIRLVMVWEKTNGRDVLFPWRLLSELTNTTFMQVDVWANDRDKNGRVVHTVNCGKREDGAPAYGLGFAKGDWATVAVR